MKKLFIGIGGLIVLLVAAALIVPSFIDWNDYKGEIIAEVEKRTGRTLAIDGDIGLTLLPAPAVVAKDLRLGNVDGAETEDMVDLRELEVRVALVPLLQGRVQVEKVRLLDPVVELETLADGRNNWEFSPPPERDPTAAPAPRVSAVGEKQSAADSGDSPVSVQFDSLEIVNGVVVYRDGATGTVERIEGLTATVAAGSLRGPFEGDGHLTARGFQTGFKAAVGEIDGDGPVAVNLVLTPKAGKARFELRGKVGDLSASPTFHRPPRCQCRRHGGTDPSGRRRWRRPSGVPLPAHGTPRRGRRVGVAGGRERSVPAPRQHRRDRRGVGDPGRRTGRFGAACHFSP